MGQPLKVISLFAAAIPLLVCVTQACGGETTGSDEASDGGSPCNANQDCVGGSCVYAGKCPGMCLPYRKQDESCGSSVQDLNDGSCTINGVPTPCVPLWGECMPDSGLACDPIAHRCLPIPPVVIADAGQPCSIFGARCNTGLYCAGLIPTSGICEPLIQNGGSCPIHNSGCADGLVCAGYGTSADATGTCQPPAPVGGDCLTTTGTEPGNSGCQWPLQCVQGKCQEAPTSGPCLNGACQADVAFCDQTSGTCQPLWEDGTPCSRSDSYPIQCRHHWCDLTGHCGTTVCPSH